MKKNIILILLLLITVGCTKQNEKENLKKQNDITYDMFTAFSKINNDITRIYAIIENTSNYSGKINHVTYVARDYDDKIITSDYKETNYELNPSEEKLIIVDLNTGTSSVESVSLAPFGYDLLELKKSEKQSSLITDDVESIDIYELESTHVKIKLSKKIDARKLKLKINNLKSIPMCLAYQDVKNSDLEYDFDCEYKLETPEFVYELYAE